MTPGDLASVMELLAEAGGLRFWQAGGWHERSEIERLSCNPEGRGNC